jgi:hypothetical protein
MFIDCVAESEVAGEEYSRHFFDTIMCDATAVDRIVGV